MNSWPAAIFFDFDGVIVNSEPLHFAAFQEVLAEQQITLTEDQYYKELIGFDDRGAFSHVYKMHERTLDAPMQKRLMARKSEVAREMIEQGRFAALPGASELIRGLHGHYPLAICSGALRHEIESMLDAIKLRDCFPIIVAAEDVSIGKPNPQGYLLTAKLVRERTGLDFANQDCLIIEDAPSVIHSVRTVGFQTLGVATSHSLQQLSGANWAVSSLDPKEILKHIPQLKVGIA